MSPSTLLFLTGALLLVVGAVGTFVGLRNEWEEYVAFCPICASLGALILIGNALGWFSP